MSMASEVGRDRRARRFFIRRAQWSRPTFCLLVAALTCAALMCAVGARAAETIPPPPQYHFNDYAHIVAPDIARRLNSELDQLERETSNQIIVAIYPRME